MIFSYNVYTMKLTIVIIRRYYYCYYIYIFSNQDCVSDKNIYFNIYFLQVHIKKIYFFTYYYSKLNNLTNYFMTANKWERFFSYLHILRLFRTQSIFCLQVILKVLYTKPNHCLTKRLSIFQIYDMQLLRTRHILTILRQPFKITYWIQYTIKILTF